MSAKQCRAEGHRWESHGSYRKCLRCGAVKREAPGPVTVKRPDPETGEVSEETATQASFKDDDVGPISAAIRDRLLRGEDPALTWPGDQPCPVEKGQEIVLIYLRSLGGPVAQVSVTITALRRGKKGEHMADYRMRDDRSLYLRARRGYTRVREDSLDPDAPILDEATMKAFNARSRLRKAERKRKNDPDREAREDIRLLNAEMRELGKRAVKMGVDVAVVLGPVARAIEQAHAEMEEAA